MDRAKDRLLTTTAAAAKTDNPSSTRPANQDGSAALHPGKYDNAIAEAVMSLYDADAMHGLPVGVQVVGARLEEEKVLAFMATVEECLGPQERETVFSRPEEAVMLRPE